MTADHQSGALPLNERAARPVRAEAASGPGAAATIISRLREAHPDASVSLDYDSPLQLLIASILAAQCTDALASRVAEQLFTQYETAGEIAALPRHYLEALFRPTGFYRQKARYIQATCIMIVEEHDGEVPRLFDELVRLPGVARKTANLVMGEALGRPVGVMVDTQVSRVAQRLHLTRHKHPKQIEQDLMELLPKSDWLNAGYLLTFHARRFCHVRHPQCHRCPLNDLCPSGAGRGRR